MTKFTINPRVVYSGDTCYVTIAAFIVISQSIYLLTHLGARTSTMSCFRVDLHVLYKYNAAEFSDKIVFIKAIAYWQKLNQFPP